VRVNFYATLRAAVGEKTVDLPIPDRSTAIDLARIIAERWPQLTDQLLDARGEVSNQVQFMIGGRNIRWLPEGSATRIGPNDIIDIFPPSAGG
jgi:molybdopterin synthase sulfur carrier subunit